MEGAANKRGGSPPHGQQPTNPPNQPNQVYRAIPSPSGSPPAAMTAVPTTKPAGGQVYRSLSVQASPRADPFVDAMAVMAVKGGDVKARSSPVTAPAASASPAAASSSSSAAAASGVPRLPLPLDMFPLSKLHMWFKLEDPEEVVARVQTALSKTISANGGQVELQRTQNKCRFECQATGNTMAESCDFAVNVFDTKGESKAPARFLVEAERKSGCPFFFSDVMEKTMCEGKPLGASFNVPPKAQQQPEKRNFLPPPLPEEARTSCPCGKGIDCACTDKDIDAVVGMALSDVHEQRLQAVCCLADACISDERFARRFGAMKGPDRIRSLLSDPNPLVRRAAARVANVALASA